MHALPESRPVANRGLPMTAARLPYRANVSIRTAAIAAVLASSLFSTIAQAATPATSCTPGFSFGAFGKLSVAYGGNSGCDAWNSSAGTYAATVSGGCDLGTNGTGSGDMWVH